MRMKAVLCAAALMAALSLVLAGDNKLEVIMACLCSCAEHSMPFRLFFEFVCRTSTQISTRAPHPAVPIAITKNTWTRYLLLLPQNADPNLPMAL